MLKNYKQRVTLSAIGGMNPFLKEMKHRITAYKEEQKRAYLTGARLLLNTGCVRI